MKTKLIILLFAQVAAAALAFGQAATPSPTPSPTPAASPSASPVAITTNVELETVNPATLSQAAPATAGAMNLTLTGTIVTITPTGACAFNSIGTGTRVGKMITFVVTTAGTSSFGVTWGTNFKAAGTLATGTVAAKKFAVSFRCLDGTTWIETGRTGAL